MALFKHFKREKNNSLPDSENSLSKHCTGYKPYVSTGVLVQLNEVLIMATIPLHKKYLKKLRNNEV